eukprot:CAMPEP_0184653016 /NCGR_PEP_ID=MMETSP0308-20130426/10742_1 /TAXON_ID=38269 /ORGANISM="Gloeochaete witrockiana, Strain SAG 46.84" /LENGTH=329 /DNA_ID=CAMNT_0027088253 /DNA_START=204 /DNA_END=1193 /DNA_ORIENTATION=-
MRRVYKTRVFLIIVAVSICLVESVRTVNDDEENDDVENLENFAVPRETDTRRIIGIGDIHGDLKYTIATLARAGLLDLSNQSWIGGDSILVSMGDVTDRGPNVIGVIKLLNTLRHQAELVGGDVIQLLGNHDIMNLMGDWRYVSEKDMKSFGGHSARKAAFSASGFVGKHFRTLPLVQIIGTSVFVHAGLTEKYALEGPDSINARHARLVHLLGRNEDEISAADAAAIKELYGNDGPVWYRGLVKDPEELACPLVLRVCKALKVNRIVVGHTKQKRGRILVRCNYRLIDIDVGIHWGRIAALEITNNVVKLLQEDESLILSYDDNYDTK